MVHISSSLTNFGHMQEILALDKLHSKLQEGFSNLQLNCHLAFWMHEDAKAFYDIKQSKSFVKVSPTYWKNLGHAQRIWIKLGCFTHELMLNRKSKASKVMIVVLNI
jgi:hypothetical protein